MELQRTEVARCEYSEYPNHWKSHGAAAASSTIEHPEMPCALRREASIGARSEARETSSGRSNLLSASRQGLRSDLRCVAFGRRCAVCSVAPRVVPEKRRARHTGWLLGACGEPLSEERPVDRTGRLGRPWYHSLAECTASQLRPRDSEVITERALL